MDKDMLEMARRNYGYGRWDAPYWFIGPQQGMGRHENNDLRLRVTAWQDLGRRELNDCREFHCRIGERRWHFKQPVNLQPAWRPLMLLMMTFQGCTVEDKDTLRNYQRDKWGSMSEETGETCVIELSGLAARSLEEGQNLAQYLPERIEVICGRIRDHRPKLVVVYGRTQIAGITFPPEPKNFVRCGPTVLAFARHPNARAHEGDQYWKELGRNLRQFAQSSAAIL